MKYYKIPPNLNDWFELIPTADFAGSAERLRFKDTRTGAEISTYYDVDNALGYFGTNDDGTPRAYFEAYPIRGDIDRCETSEELFEIVFSEFDRIWRGGDKPAPTVESLIWALRNLYNDYALNHPTDALNSPAMKAAFDIFKTVEDLSEINKPNFNPINRSGNL